MISCHAPTPKNPDFFSGLTPKEPGFLLDMIGLLRFDNVGRHESKTSRQPF